MAFAIIGLEVSGKRRKKVRIKKDKLIELDNKFIRELDKKLKHINFLYKLKESFVSELGVINTKNRSENSAIVLWTMLFMVTVGIVVGIVVSRIFIMYHIVVLLSLFAMFIVFYIANFYLNLKLKKARKQFPSAIQIFTDEYISASNRNIKVALNNSYDKMPKEIALPFERLTRELSSSHEYEQPIVEFAKSLNYVWGYAFAELLLISYEGSGDISEDLLFLNELINEDIKGTEDTISELASNKIMFFIITVATFIGFLFTLNFNPIAKNIYFYTPQGANIFLYWIIVVIIGIGASIYMEKT